MPQPDQPARRVDRTAPAHSDAAVLDRFPAFPRCGQAKVVDRHVLGNGEAIVRFDRVDLRDTVHPCALARIANRAADLREDIGFVPAPCDLGGIRYRRGAMPPARNAWEAVQRDAPLARIVGSAFGRFRRRFSLLYNAVYFRFLRCGFIQKRINNGAIYLVERWLHGCFFH